MKKLTILTFVILLIVSCNSESGLNSILSKDYSTASNTEPQQSLGYEDDPVIVPPESSPEKPNIEKGGKIIKEGNMHMEVENLNESKNHIDSFVYKNEGYYEKETFRNSEYAQRYSLKIRIPSSKFMGLVSFLEEGKGMILEKNINAKDVTEEYLDLEIRLENNKAYLQRYNELLKKAKSIKDMLEIQERIRQIELLIDSNLGRINYLSDKVKYSTLTLELTKKADEVVADAGPSFFDDIFGAFKNGFSGLLYFIVILANLWPIFLSVFLIWILRRKMFGRLIKKSS